MIIIIITIIIIIRLSSNYVPIIRSKALLIRVIYNLKEKTRDARHNVFISKYLHRIFKNEIHSDFEINIHSYKKEEKLIFKTFKSHS